MNGGFGRVRLMIMSLMVMFAVMFMVMFGVRGAGRGRRVDGIGCLGRTTRVNFGRKHPGRQRRVRLMAFVIMVVMLVSMPMGVRIGVLVGIIVRMIMLIMVMMFVMRGVGIVVSGI